jgi:hypothetical protein
MNLQELLKLATDGRIDELEIHSLEGGFYIVRALLDNDYRTLLDTRGEPMRLRSTTQLRDLLHLAPALPCVLVQQVVHDEMCGQREGPIEPLRIPFSLQQTF